MKKSLLALLGFAVLALLLYIGYEKREGAPAHKEVVVYVSEDRVFSEPILKDFEKETGIKVRAVYDTEETKSTGVMNRLIAEKSSPGADVYWANEPIRVEVLKRKGILAPYISKNARGIAENFKDPEGYWCGFSARIRVFVVRKGAQKRPASIMDYTDPEFKGKGVIANPLFGTTTSHIAALFTVWGAERTEAFMNAMKRNGVAISTSNGESADIVAMGAADFALVDSDDAVNRIRQGKPVTMVYPDQEEGGLGCFVVPNVAVLIKGAKHPSEAKLLIDYLLSKETERKLAFADCAQIPLHKGVAVPPELKPLEQIRTMDVDYAKVAEELEKIQPFLKQWAGL